MKKLVLSTVAAAMLATSASAVTVGLGTDVIGGQSVLRVSVDGLAKGLRIEPRFAYASFTNSNAAALSNTSMTMGIGAYYDVAGPVAVGFFFDTTSAKVDGKISDAATGAFGNMYTAAANTSMGLGLKVEKELTKNFSISYELGYASTKYTNYSVAGTADADTNTDLAPYSGVTMRLFF